MPENSVGRIEDGVCDVRAWLGRHFLKWNANKTDVILIGSRRQTAKVHLSHVTIDGETAAPSTCVRNFGLVIDSGMKMHPTLPPSAGQQGITCRTLARSESTRLSMPVST